MSCTTSMPPPKWPSPQSRHHRTCGTRRARSGARRVALYDAERRQITAPDTIGTIFVSSGLSFSGYTDGPNKEIVDGLLSSGDLGHFDAEGRLFIDGRDDDMIVSGGENVYPLEVENLLVDRPDILDAAVVGVDDHDFGKRLRAFGVRAPGAGTDADELRAHVKAHLARHKVPRDAVFVEELSRNATGKLLRRRLETAGPEAEPPTPA